jgi:hypothetical protein
MTRGQIRATLERVRVPVEGQALVHILFSATLDGLIVRGPMLDGEHAFVLVADWLGERPKLDRDRALAELAQRYLAAHGPACDRDLVKWARVTLRDARVGLQAIAPHLVQYADGLVDLRRKASPRLPAPRLLAAFDPILLGWASRKLVLGDAERQIVANGMIRAIALVDGRAAGTWTLPRGRVQLDLWRSQTPSTMRRLASEASAIESYLAQRLPLSAGDLARSDVEPVENVRDADGEKQRGQC